MMSRSDEDAMDAWLAEVDMAKDYVTKLANNEINVEEFDRKQKKVEEEKFDNL